MKKTLAFIAAIFAGAMLFSCQSELGKETVAPVLREYTISIDATKPADTKALALSSDGKSLSATWEEGEQVAVCKIDPTNNDLSEVLGMLAPTTFGSASTVLKGSILMDGVNAGDKLFLQYPYKVIEDSETGKLWLDGRYSGQDGSLNTLSKEFAFATCGVDITSLEGDALVTTKAEFFNRQAIVKFTLKNAGSPLEATKLRIYAPSLAERFWHDDYYVNWGSLEVKPMTAATSEFTVALRNQESDPEPYTLYAVNSTGVYTATTAPMTFADGSYNRGTGNLNPFSYASCEDASEWSVIGALSQYNVTWDNDLNMWTNGSGLHVAASVNLAAGDEFKIRKNRDWGFNFGGPLYAVPDAFSVYQDGANIVIPEDGVYDIYLDEYTYTAIIVPASNAGKTSTLMSVPEPVTGWNVIGLGGDWGHDVLATEVSTGVWAVEVTVASATTFKWRKDGAWDENFGGTMTALDEPFVAVTDGDPIPLDPGEYKLILDLTGTAPMICVVPRVPCWSLIGEFTSWSSDVDMTQDSEGKWVSPATTFSGNFKLRWNHDWYENRGADAPGTYDVPVGTAFHAEPGGQNLNLTEEASYIVTYDPVAETILVVKAGSVPEPEYTVVGASELDSASIDRVFTSQWNTDEANDMTDADEDGVYEWSAMVTSISAELPVEFKIVKNHSFSTCWPSGDNYKFSIYGDGLFNVTFKPSTGEINAWMEYTCPYTVAGGSGVFGSEWDPCDPTNNMIEQSDGTWVLVKENIPAGQGVTFQVVKDHHWDGGKWPSDPYVHTVVGPGNVDLVITFNPATGAIDLREVKVQPIKIDGSFDDWAALDPAKVSVATYATESSNKDDLKTLKVYANEQAVYVYVEFDLSGYNPGAVESATMEIYLNGDNNTATGGWRAFWDQGTTPCIDLLLQGAVIEDGAVVDYGGSAYKYAGLPNTNEWTWENVSVDGFVYGKGSMVAYEIKLDRWLYPLGTLADTFTMGVDVMVNGWDATGVLPTSGSPLLVVQTDK